MIYNGAQIDIVEAQKPYIDTVIVPIIEVVLGSPAAKTQATAAHFILEVAKFIEHQLKGRLLLLPAITYLSGQQKTVNLAHWRAHLQQAGYPHVLFLTAEAHWLDEQQPIIWLPAIPLEAMDFSMQQKIIEEQFKQVLTTLSKLWSETQLSNG